MKKQREREGQGAPALRMRRGGRGGRGFTLVELAIVITVTGLLLGASLIPMRMLDERRQLRAETRRMEIARDAIAGYALRHRTRARAVTFQSQDPPHAARTFRLPAGRPYLPCPDWDGDGFEDRFPEGRDGFMQGLEVRPDLAVTAVIAATPDNDSLFWADADSSAAGNANALAARPYGECMVSRGTIPWRTLGVEPADRWGNRHTYYVDAVFANAIFGFDRRTIADVFDPRVPRAPGFNPARRHGANIVDEARNDALCPAAVCDGARAVDCLNFAIADFSAGYGCERRVGNPRNAGDPAHVLSLSEDMLTPAQVAAGAEKIRGLVLKAGAAAKSDIPPESSGGKFFRSGDVTDGLPFVIVSHGPNGRFAVNHWGSLSSPLNAAGVKTPLCNPQDSDVSLNENFDQRAVFHETINATRLSPDERRGRRSARCPRTFYEKRAGGFNIRFSSRESSFVWEPPGSKNFNEFDDLLLWMTREELATAVPGVIPPLPPMFVAHFPVP